MVDAIDALMDPGCFGEDDLVFRGWRNTEMVEGCLLGQFLTWIRNRCRQRLGARVPKAHPDERQTGGQVSIFAVDDAANGVHVGY